MEFEYCKIEIYIPKTHLAVLQHALICADAGHIGNYDGCMSYGPVTGCWRPLDGSAPFIGETGTLSTEAEYKVEVICKKENVEKTISAVKEVHPYEVPVINAIPLYKTGF